jgi:K+-sensing histidine kinase KdpD
MKHELAGIPAWAYIVGMPTVLVAAATPALLAVDSLLPPNLIWLCYLLPVVLASVRWGFASAAATAIAAGLAGDFFFTQPYYSLWMDDPSDVIALLSFLLAAFGSALLITSVKQSNDGVRETVSAVATRLPELSELADRQTIAAAADYALDPRFTYQWRTSLTTILGAAGVLLMRGKSGANRLDRALLTDIRDEARSLSQLLTDAFPVSSATGHETRPRQIGLAALTFNPGKKPH